MCEREREREREKENERGGQTFIEQGNEKAD